MKLQNKIMLGCFGILVLFMISILVRCVTVHLLIKKMHIDNVFTQIVLFDNDDLRKLGSTDQSKEEKGIVIDWEILYPFEKSNEIIVNSNGKNASVVVDKINSRIEKVEGKITDWTTKHLLEHNYIVEINAKCNKILGWNIQSYTEYNGVIELEDGQLASFYERKDMTEKINNVTSIAKFCKSQNIDFLYVSAPGKIARNEQKYKGLDYSNENADEFLAGLKNNNVNYIDLRDNVEAEGLNLRSLFFRTDHHWLPQTGLWAAGVIAKYLADKNIVVGDLSLLNPDRYEEKVYEKCFLGSRGMKIRLSHDKYDDISVIYPIFPVKYEFKLPEKNICKIGDFQITFDMSRLEYNDQAYGVYNYGTWKYTSINNFSSVNNNKILVLYNSFGRCVTPFLALQCKYLETLDLRDFSGSIQSYIKATKPDVVIVLYHIEQLNDDIKYEDHNSLWDFR